MNKEKNVSKNNLFDRRPKKEQLGGPIRPQASNVHILACAEVEVLEQGILTAGKHLLCIQLRGAQQYKTLFFCRGPTETLLVWFFVISQQQSSTEHFIMLPKNIIHSSPVSKYFRSKFWPHTQV